MKLIPALDIIDSQVVRLTQGDYDQKTVYSKDPVMMARLFKEYGAKRLHLVDLDGARMGNPVHTELFGRIKKETGLIIEAGGGIRNLSDFESYFNSGFDVSEDFIMMGSLAIKNPDAFFEIQKKFGKNILHTVDVWDRNVRISGWKEDSRINIFTHMKNMINSGISNFLVTQIKKDGMLSGPDTELYRDIFSQFPDVSVIVSGGISSLNDMKSLSGINNISGFILGRAFYENKVSLEDIRKYHLLQE